MISRDQAAAYLDELLGITVPSFLLSAAHESVEALEPAMLAAGYSEPKMVQVQAMAVAIVAAAGAPRRIQSQGAPSGASRSFKHDDDALTALRRSLSALDTAGITAGLVGPDPKSGTLLLVTC
jgi:hypothetical protein